MLRGPDRTNDETSWELDELAWLRERYAGRLWIAAELHRNGSDRDKLARLAGLGQRFALPLVASGDVLMHVAQRRMLQDVMVALRHRRPVAHCEIGKAACRERVCPYV